MPSPYVKKLSKETGKSVDEIEKLWDKAKKSASDHFDKSEDDFGSEEYAYTVGIVKKMLGMDEMLLDPNYFLSSEKSAIDFIKDAIAQTILDETMTSSSVGLSSDHPIIMKDKNKENEPEEEEEPEEVKPPRKQLEIKEGWI